MSGVIAFSFMTSDDLDSGRLSPAQYASQLTGFRMMIFFNYRYGPRSLYKPTSPPYTITLEDLPFLSPCEFVRAKLKSSRWLENDADDVAYMVSVRFGLALHPDPHG